MKKLVLLFALCSMVRAYGQEEKIDTAVISKIRREVKNNSQVMEILNMLTDVNGHRLTNSPGYKRAAEYAKKSMEGWGLSNVHFDTWGKMGRDWILKRFNLQVIEPTYFPVIAFPMGWSPGIKGPVTVEVVYLNAATAQELQSYRGKLKGKAVMISSIEEPSSNFVAPARRLQDSSLLKMSNDIKPKYGQWKEDPLNYKKWMLCQDEGALVVLERSYAGKNGTLFVDMATVPYETGTPFTKWKFASDADAPKILPQVAISTEHYNRMARILMKNLPMKVELTLDAEYLKPEDGFNVIAEIPGTDLKNEIVMIGAHLDSWHSGTGATDNGAGVAVCMEALRIIKGLGVQPRRTIRIGLWSGEEEGLFGSLGYVNKHLAERFDKNKWGDSHKDSIRRKPDYENFSVYFNMDNGTGKFRGIYMEKNEKVRPIFRSWFRPFENEGTATLTPQNTGGTDHGSFDWVGLPGFQFIQDPIDYGTVTHHSNLDVFDRVQEKDLRHNVIVMASFAWMAAMRDKKFPRRWEN